MQQSVVLDRLLGSEFGNDPGSGIVPAVTAGVLRGECSGGARGGDGIMHAECTDIV